VRCKLNILFLTHPYPNYVPDLLLHGLRKLLGPQVVDYPRKDSLYRGELLGIAPDDQLCPNIFPADDGAIDREDISQKLKANYFKYVICDSRLTLRVIKSLDDVYASIGYGGLRTIPLFQDESRSLPSGLVVVDGEDYPFYIPPGPYVVCRRETDGSEYSIPLPMALPEELWQWIHSFRSQEKVYSVGFLGSDRAFFHGGKRGDILEILSRRYPDSLLQTSAVPSSDNPSPDGRLNRRDYYTSMQKCRIVLSLRGDGYDTFRFWENAACHAVHIAQKMPLFIPNDFEQGRQILRFGTMDEMIETIDTVLDGRIKGEQIIERSHEQLTNFHLTEKRAMYLLDRLRKAFYEQK
jgi:hypothetical protein